MKKRDAKIMVYLTQKSVINKLYKEAKYLRFTK